VIDLVDETEQGLLFLAERGAFHILHHRLNQSPATQQFRRDRGVSL
jgi:hypothetical protein